MKYDFSTLPNRWNTGAEKYENMISALPEVKPGTVPFSVADMDFLPPPELVQGLKDYVDSTIFGYTMTWDGYYDSVISWIKRHHGMDIPREWIVNADNVLAGIAQMISSKTQPTDKVVVLTPAYPGFPPTVDAAKRELLRVPLDLKEGHYSINYDLLEDTLRRADVTFLIFCNPHNPIGRGWTEEEMNSVAEICLRNNVFLCCDEIHWDIVMSGHKIGSVANLPEKYWPIIAVGTSACKTFNISGLKGGYLLIPDPDNRAAYKSYEGIPGRNVVAYKAAEIAYTSCEDWMTEMIEVIDSNRVAMEEFLRAELPDVGIQPLEATYLQWLDFRYLGFGAAELEKFMQHEANLFFTEGYKFGDNGVGFERWNLACPRQVMMEGLERLKKAITTNGR